MILDDIKAASITARKNRESKKAASLITLLSEATMVGKNEGRETTDAETIAVIKKFIKNLDQILPLLAEGDERFVDATTEKELINSFLPAQLTEEKIREILIDIVKVNGFDVANKPMGEMLKILKFKYEGRYDGGLAARIAKDVIATWQS